MTTHLITIYDKYGDNPINIDDDYISVEYTRKINEVGDIRIEISPVFGFKNFTEDMRMELLRVIPGKAPYRPMDTIWFLTKKGFGEDNAGNEKIVLIGEDQNTFFSRRTVPYPQETSYTQKTTYADDMIKEIVRENYGSGALDPYRDMSASGDDPDVLVVEGNRSASIIISHSFVRQDVIRVLQDIAKISYEEGIFLAFDTEFMGFNNFIFKTYIDYRGSDKSLSSTSPVVISKENNNLSRPELAYDWTKKKTYAYAIGHGSNIDIPTKEVYTSARYLRGLSRREVFADARNSETEEDLEFAAKKVLRENAGKVYFTGNLADTQSTRFGINYEFGDLLSVQYQGLTIPVITSVISVKDNKDGERITTKLDGYLYEDDA